MSSLTFPCFNHIIITSRVIIKDYVISKAIIFLELCSPLVKSIAVEYIQKRNENVNNDGLCINKVITMRTHGEDTRRTFQRRPEG